MEFFVENISLVLFLPIVMCFVIGFNSILSNKLDKDTLFSISIISSFLMVLFSMTVCIYSFLGNKIPFALMPWFSTDEIVYSLGVYLDKISTSFLLFACVVNFVMQLWVYFNNLKISEYTRFLFLQNLFCFSLNGLFLSPNLFQTYVFCEIAGVSSYMFLNFNFSNRTESKKAIKLLIFNRVADLALLFSLLLIFYYSIVYNELYGVNSISYLELKNIIVSMNSLLNIPLSILFSSILLFVIVMKFMQSFAYLTFDIKKNNYFSNIIFIYNLMISSIGFYLIFRLFPFFAELNSFFVWAFVSVFLIFVLLAFANKLFIPLCKLFEWIEKYIIETVVNLAEFFIRFFSYLCSRFQAGNFQSYLLYSLIGLVFIFVFILIFYEFLIKV